VQLIGLINRRGPARTRRPHTKYVGQRTLVVVIALNFVLARKINRQKSAHAIDSAAAAKAMVD
jgi:hypothetical protein